MRAKQKLSVTIEKKTLRAIEMASKACSMPKSQVAQDAFRLWLQKRDQELLGKAYDEMAKEDLELAKVAFDAQPETRP